jgi:hypothetical protein
MTAPTDQAHYNFFRLAIEYYINGRSAFLSGCSMTGGNLLHHAVEMLLKGELAKTVSLQDLKDDRKFGHWLPKCWDAFKALFPSENLSEFDTMIVSLDKFERIRYPDNVLKEGMGMTVGFGRWKHTPVEGTADPVPKYQLAVGDVDAFFARAVPLCGINPPAYIHCLTDHGREALTKFNDYANNWLR